MGGGKSSNSAQIAEQRMAAEEARQKEAARQARLQQGLDQINNVFDGGSGGSPWQQAFLADYTKGYNDYYQPQLNQQFEDAKKQLTFNLARSGLTRSGVAADEVSDLERQRLEQNSAIISQADQATAALKQRIASDKQAAINQLYATENPDIGANAALDSVRTIQAEQPRYSPLGDLFRVAQVGAQNIVDARRDREYYNTLTGVGLNKNSGKVIY